MTLIASFRRSVPGMAAAAAVAMSLSCSHRSEAVPPSGPPPSADMRARDAQVVVSDVAAQSAVSMRVGQTLGIVAPSKGPTYQLDFAASQLRLVTPASSISEPGDRGWVFQAVAAGQLDVVITARARCASPPCSENPARYTVTVKIGPATAMARVRQYPSRERAGEEDGDRKNPDQPDEAMKWRQIFERDENGRIPANGLIIASQQMRAMRVRQEAARAIAGGDPEPTAGLSPGGFTWLGPGNIGGRTRAIAIHPTTTSTMFAGSVSGGIWTTTNSGGTWSVVDDFMANLAVSSIVYNPVDLSVMYAGTGEGFFNFDAIRGAGVFKSTNGGTTWSQLANTATSDFFFVNRLAISPNGATLLAATSTGVWRSTDAGVNWTRTLNVTQMRDVKFIPGSNDLAVASGNAKDAYWSNNGGASFTAATGFTSAASGKRVEIGVSVSAAGTVFAVVDEANGSSTPPAELWKSVDSGQTYALVFAGTPAGAGTSLLGAQGWYDNAIWIDPTDATHLVVAGVSAYRSTNGGTVWSVWSGGHADYHTFVSDPNFNGSTNRRVYIGNDGGVYKWEDVTVNSPTELNNNLGITQFYGADGLTSNGKFFGGTQDNGTILFQPGGGANQGPEGWTLIAGGDGGYATTDKVNNYLYGETQWLGVHRSNNGAASQSLTGCSKSAPFILTEGCTAGLSNFIAPLLIDPNSPDRLYAGGRSLWRTSDPRTATTVSTGPSWAVIKSPIAGNSNISAIAIAKTNSQQVWVGHNNGDVYSTDDGLSATPTWFKRDDNATALPNRAATSIAVDPTNANRVWVAFGGFNANNIWVTNNNGASWAAASGSGGGTLPSVPVRAIVAHPSAASWLYAGTDVGLFASADGGATWALPHEGPANVAVFNLTFVGNTLVVVTHGRGIYTIDVAPPNTGPTIVTHPASQSVASGQTALLTVAATGTAPFSYQWYQGPSPSTLAPIAGATSASFTTPAVTATVKYWVRVSNAFGTADSNTASVSISAVFDGTLQAPKCVAVGVECDSGPTLLLGRDTISGGPEPNQPNTINDSCADHVLGSFHVDESIDRVRIISLDGTPFAAGKQVRVDVTLWAFDTGDRLDIYQTSNANSPSWTFVATVAAIGGGAQTLSATYTLPAGGLQAVRGVLRHTDFQATAVSCSAGSYTDHDDVIFAVSAPGPELITNGNFSSAPTLPWELFDGANIVHNNGAGGEFRYHRNPVVTGTGTAVIFQKTGVAVPVGTAVTATFDLGNLDTVRKRISILIWDADFSDLAVCTFILPANAPMRTYSMSTHPTKNWVNAQISFYTASNGVGDYRLDNVSMRTDNAASPLRTNCVDPTTAAAPGGAAGPNLLTNNSFASGTTGWNTFNDITFQVAGGVFEFLRPGTPGQLAGGILQITGQAMTAGQILTSTFQLGNSSSVRKRVTILFHDEDFGDLTACTFILAPFTALSNYSMRWATTEAWTNAYWAIFAATTGPEQWTQLDNVTLTRTPGSIAVGTECVEPGATLPPAPAPPPAPLPAPSDDGDAGPDASPAILAGARPRLSRRVTRR